MMARETRLTPNSEKNYHGQKDIHSKRIRGRVSCRCSRAARQGFLELQTFVIAAHQSQRPVDGYYVTFGAS
ncbi:MAG TPA: hypothetical protein VGT08_19640 [Terracidiphilus sp.]|nr:hypothetical protein [Terracidiphilus sp.]